MVGIEIGCNYVIRIHNRKITLEDLGENVKRGKDFQKAFCILRTAAVCKRYSSQT